MVALVVRQQWGCSSSSEGEAGVAVQVVWPRLRRGYRVVACRFRAHSSSSSNRRCLASRHAYGPLRALRGLNPGTLKLGAQTCLNPQLFFSLLGVGAEEGHIILAINAQRALFKR